MRKRQEILWKIHRDGNKPDLSGHSPEFTSENSFCPHVHEHWRRHGGVHERRLNPPPVDGLVLPVSPGVRPQSQTQCAEGRVQLMNPQVFSPPSRNTELWDVYGPVGTGVRWSAFPPPPFILWNIPSDPISGSSFSPRGELVTGVRERWSRSSGGWRNPLYSRADLIRKNKYETKKPPFSRLQGVDTV